MSMTFQREPLAHCWNQVMELAYQHWQGTSSYRRHEPFSPSFQRYQGCEEMGFFQLHTARDAERLVGYFGVYVTPSMHSQLLMATEDTFFLHPDARGGRNALRFLRYIEETFSAAGVHEVIFSCESDNESGIQGLLKHLDYQPVIVQYRKVFSPRADSAQPAPQEVA